MKKLVQIKKGLGQIGDSRAYIVIVELLPLPHPGLDCGRIIAFRVVDEVLAPRDGNAVETACFQTCRSVVKSDILPHDWAT